MATFFIYKITNTINGKCYIGFTCDIKTRWGHHRSAGLVNKPLHKAIRKYGADAFVFEIIEESTDRKYLLLEREPFWIDHFQSYSKGYNIVRAGLNTNTKENIENNRIRMKSNNPMFNEETRAKVSKTLTGRKGMKRSEDHRKAIANGKIGDKNPMFNNPHAADHLNGPIACDFCGVSTNKGNIARWHRQCKDRKSQGENTIKTLIFS